MGGEGHGFMVGLAWLWLGLGSMDRGVGRYTMDNEERHVFGVLRGVLV
jgi:hypothetical protein